MYTYINHVLAKINAIELLNYNKLDNNLGRSRHRSGTKHTKKGQRVKSDLYFEGKQPKN